MPVPSLGDSFTTIRTVSTVDSLMDSVDTVDFGDARNLLYSLLFIYSIFGNINCGKLSRVSSWSIVIRRYIIVYGFIMVSPALTGLYICKWLDYK